MSSGGAGGRRDGRPDGRPDERGAATLLTLAMAGVLLFVTSALGVVGGLVVTQRRSQAAADLAALAGAHGLQRGRDACRAAADVAAANGAALVGCDVTGREVMVRVRVRGPEAIGRTFDLTARARAGPAP